MQTKEEIRAFAVKLASDNTDCPDFMMSMAKLITRFIETGEWESEGGCNMEREDKKKREFLESLDTETLPQG